MCLKNEEYDYLTYTYTLSMQYKKYLAFYLHVQKLISPIRIQYII